MKLDWNMSRVLQSSSAVVVVRLSYTSMTLDGVVGRKVSVLTRVP